MLLEADPNVGLDFLGRPTVLRDPNWIQAASSRSMY